MEFTAADDKPKGTLDSNNIEWLRERGVQIDIPSSREAAKAIDHNLDRPVTIVKIPYDTKEPYEEVTITINDGIAGDQLLNLLKPRFIGTGTESISNAALEKASENLLQSVQSTKQAGDASASADGTSILDKSPEVQKSTLLSMFENQGHVEAFTLTHASENNQWKSVAIYLDEGGQLKGLPSNPRAASIAAVCGFEGISLAGDVYIARRFQEGVIRHVSFTLAEVDSSAGWMVTAQRDNYARGAASGQVSMDPSRVPGSIDKGIHTSTDPKKAYEWSQDDDTVDVTFQLPEGYRSTSKKNLHVTISSQGLLVTCTPEGGGDKIVLLELSLFAAVKVNDSTWSRSGDCVEIALEKREEGEDWTQLEA